MNKDIIKELRLALKSVGVKIPKKSDTDEFVCTLFKENEDVKGKVLAQYKLTDEFLEYFKIPHTVKDCILYYGNLEKLKEVLKNPSYFIDSGGYVHGFINDYDGKIVNILNKGFSKNKEYSYTNFSLLDMVVSTEPIDKYGAIKSYAIKFHFSEIMQSYSFGKYDDKLVYNFIPRNFIMI